MGVEAILFMLNFLAVVAVAAAAAWQHGWTRGWRRGLDDERERSRPTRRVFRLTLCNKEPMGVIYTSVTASMPAPVTSESWQSMLKRCQQRMQSQHLPDVISAVELDKE